LIAIVAAMKQEVAGLMRDMGHIPDMPPSSLSVHVTGVGKEKALAGAKRLLNGPIRPDAILSLGFAGALRDRLATGDLVLSRRLYSSEEEGFLESDARLLGLAQEALRGSTKLRHFVADNLTVPEAVSSAEGKRRLAETTTAWLVNMEDYWIAKAAIQRGMPFLSVRAVLDTAHQELPLFLAGLGGKGPLVQALHVVANGIAGPKSVPGMLKLSRQVRVAQDSLTAFGLSFVPLTLASGNPPDPPLVKGGKEGTGRGAGSEGYLESYE